MDGRAQSLGGDPGSGPTSTGTQTPPPTSPLSPSPPSLPSTSPDAATHAPLSDTPQTPLAPLSIPAADPQRKEGREDWASPSDTGSVQVGQEKPLALSLPLLVQRLSSHHPPDSAGLPRKDRGLRGQQREEVGKPGSPRGRSKSQRAPLKLLPAQESQKETQRPRFPPQGRRRPFPPTGFPTRRAWPCPPHPRRCI